MLTGHAIIVLEFKVGTTTVSNLDKQQTEDYLLDLFDFHAASRAHPIVPVLMATHAKVALPERRWLWHAVMLVLVASGEGR